VHDTCFVCARSARRHVCALPDTAQPTETGCENMIFLLLCDKRWGRECSRNGRIVLSVSSSCQEWRLQKAAVDIVGRPAVLFVLFAPLTGRCCQCCASSVSHCMARRKAVSTGKLDQRRCGKGCARMRMIDIHQGPTTVPAHHQHKYTSIQTHVHMNTNKSHSFPPTHVHIHKHIHTHARAHAPTRPHFLSLSLSPPSLSYPPIHTNTKCIMNL